MHYARTTVTKPLVQGEIGYENLGANHFEGFQRTAFWLSMLNGAAGHTYGANGTWEAYTSDKPLHRLRWSFMSWEEGMRLPGSYQVGLGANLLRQYRWWLFKPHPEWVTPRGTTLLEPRQEINGFNSDLRLEMLASSTDVEDLTESWGEASAGGEWKARNGNFRRPYAAGIPGIKVENGQFAGGPFDWLTPFGLMCGLGLIVGYALIGSCWLVMKSHGVDVL